MSDYSGWMWLLKRLRDMWLNKLALEAKKMSGKMAGSS